MKILQVSTNWGHGGPGGVVKDIFDVVKEHGHDCVVGYGRFEIPENVPSIRIGTEVDIYKHALYSRFLDNAGFNSQRATTNFIKKINYYKPDIIHLHNLLGYYIDVEILFEFLKASMTPVVWTLHDCWAFTGHCINFERINCQKWKTNCYNCELKKEYPKSYLFDRCNLNYLKKKRIFNFNGLYLVTPSKWLADLVSESFLNKHPLKVIHNGIDLNIFQYKKNEMRKKYGIENKIVLLAVAGIWNKMKGEQLIYDLARKIDDNHVIVMIGKKSRYEHSEKIINIDKTNDLQELVAWYSASDIFINPTLGDNFPTVNIEALACGLPIVTNNTGGSSEVAGNVFGRIVYSKSVDEFLIKIHECELANIQKKECREASLKFDKHICFNKYIDLYKNIINQHRML